MSSIEVMVNGKLRTVERPASLLEFLERLDINPQAIAVERNGVIIRREQYGDIQIEAGDVLEIVRMVGGGRV